MALNRGSTGGETIVNSEVDIRLEDGRIPLNMVQTVYSREDCWLVGPSSTVGRHAFVT